MTLDTNTIDGGRPNSTGARPIAPILIRGGKVAGPDLAPGVNGVIVENGRISRVVRPQDYVGADVTVIDCGSEAVIMPGMIDLHTHGGWGHRYTDGADSARQILRQRVTTGCTGLLMTVGNYRASVANSTQPHAWVDDMCAWLPDLAALVESEGSMRDDDRRRGATDGEKHAPKASGASVAIGFHIEGPWLNWDAWVKWGAREASGRSAIAPEWEHFAKLQEAARGHIRQVSVAPEFPGAIGFIARLAGAGVLVSIGHTTAEPELVREAIDAGARLSTHTFNGMQPLHHRNPGVAGTVLTDDRLTCELIADGAHVHPIMQNLVWRAKGAERVALITDATAWAGFAPGSYADPSSGRSFEIRDDLGCWSPTGNLAGSGSPADRNVALICSLGNVPVSDVARMSATVPSTLLGLGRTKGRIAAGYDADIWVSAPIAGARLGGSWPEPHDAPGSDFRCVLTMVAGEVVWHHSGGGSGE